jgi:hypothetical protein
VLLVDEMIAVRYHSLDLIFLHLLNVEEQYQVQMEMIVIEKDVKNMLVEVSEEKNVVDDVVNNEDFVNLLKSNMLYVDDMTQTYDQHLIENEIIVLHDVLKEEEKNVNQSI